MHFEIWATVPFQAEQFSKMKDSINVNFVLAKVIELFYIIQAKWLDSRTNRELIIVHSEQTTASW